jgi:hypothetical protein
MGGMKAFNQASQSLTVDGPYPAFKGPAFKTSLDAKFAL